MSEQQPKFHPWFHKFMIFFALWAYALFAFLYGIRNIWRAVENGVEFLPLVIILNVLLILLGVFTIAVRFDLAAFRPRAPKELLGICLGAAAIIRLLQLVRHLSAEDVDSGRILSAVIFTCWGIALYRYYNDRKYLFTRAAEK